ncbi:MarR family winged helix-turn-helix transcriptional regulator [Liquorilactobacillus uvarum]|uniref:HTH marR-type domain-containing protein n=1 Tax=Liquorilactobacillus uvarum DSM 19971 TaxID=1423812 RepID=A0A0R1Q929_9LACO|nr:MarR family winged helix-turn-helix transcriptional regulator [Liquorilactobacillus uvarum]KRL37907.1 hypothetical protein FD20_GL002445 [Liquorilactobacillus uvarum DSM 19971]
MNERIKKALTNLQCEFVAERNVVNPLEIKWIQYDILAALAKKKMLPSELSKYLGISRSKLSKNLFELRKNSYIEQIPSRTDHRELVTCISDKGRKFLINIDAGHRKLTTIAINVLSQEEQAEFIKIAEKLADALGKERLTNGR